MDDIKIMEKPEWVSWDNIHQILVEAHAENIAKGMTMRTVNLTGEELKERLGRGKCFVAIDSAGKVVGTASVSISEIDTWYYKGVAGKLMLAAIIPSYQGRGIYSMLQDCRYEYARESGAGILLMDTAEHNKKMQNVLAAKGFRYVSAFASQYSKHYSVVMAKWMDACPYSSLYCRLMFLRTMFVTKLRFKPGQIKRFK